MLTEPNTGTAEELASLLEGYREEIVAAWARLLYALPNSRYATLPVTDLQAELRDEIISIVTLFRRGSYDQLEAVVYQNCHRRVEQGFDVSEVIQGILLLKEALVPVIWREAQWEPDDALRVLAEFDRVLHWMVIQFSRVYSLEINQQLAEQVELLTESQQRLQEQNSTLANQSHLLERRVKEISALNRSATLITSTLELDRVMDLILETLAEVVTYDSASIMWVIDGGLRVIACRGFRDPQSVLGTRFDPARNSLTFRLLNEAKPIVICDATKEPFFDRPADNIGSWIGVPLRVRDESIGAITLDKAECEYYDDEDGNTVMAFASHAALALDNARLYAESRERAVLEDRNRLARELHDSLSQMLFSMVLNAEAANALFDSSPDKARVQISRLQETAHAALKDMRTLIFELRPANLEAEGLVPVLRKHAALTGERNGIEMQVRADGQRRWPFNIEKALFRIAQEALANVVKHSGATQATVTLNATDSMLKLTIDDNGKGVEASTAKRGRVRNSLGLTSMRERAEALGGRFTIGPRPDSTGTRVAVEVPLETGNT